MITARAVEKHVTSIFGKLNLEPTDEDHRRVLAVLTFLRSRRTRARKRTWRWSKGEESGSSSSSRIRVEELGAVGAVQDPVVAARLSGIRCAVVISPSRTTGRSTIDPTARIAAWGGLITAEKLVMPYIPRFETVNVPPESSGGDRSLAHPLR